MIETWIPKRNELCPCKSGIKYKKCCSPKTFTRDIIDNVQIQAEINNDFILEECFATLKNSSEVIQFILQNSVCNNEAKQPEFLEIDKNFVQISIGEFNSNEIQERVKNWIIQKGILDLNMALKYALNMIKSSFMFFKNDWGCITVKEFLNKIPKIEEKAFEDDKIDNLFADIKRYIGLRDTKLVYEDEIRSLNDLRNQIIHYNGIVLKNRFQVNWIKIDALKEDENGITEINLPEMLKAGTKIKISFSPTSKVFKRREKLHFSYKEFTEMYFTVAIFLKELVAILKFPDFITIDHPPIDRMREFENFKKAYDFMRRRI